MVEISFPVYDIDGSRFQVVADMSLYTKEALLAAVYKYTDRFYIHQQAEGNSIRVIFETKDGGVLNETIVKQFCNELIDQQIRYNTNIQFGHIRDLIVEEAFKPVSL